MVISANDTRAPAAFSACTVAREDRKVYGSYTTGEYLREKSAIAANPDDPRYRDYDSNSSAGSGLVTGRVTGPAADTSGHVYAGAANGGVWRSDVGDGS